MNPTNRTRRKFLKASGMALTTATVSGVTSANSKNNKKVTAEEAGILNAVERFLHNNDIEKAIALLERHNVEYYHNQQTPLSDSDGVTSQDFYQKSSSNINFVTYYEGGNELKYGVYWSLDGGNHDIDGPKPKDVAVLAFDPNHFDYVVGSVDHHGQLNDGYLYGDQTDLLTWPSKADAEHRDRAVVQMRDGEANAQRASGYLEMNVTSGSGTSWLSTNYTHTWSFTNSAQWSSILQDISVSLGGLISVNVPSTADSWELNDEVVA